MPRYWTKTVLTALVCLMPAVSGAQGRTAGQIVGTVKDASGAVVPKAELILIDNGTGTTTETRSGADGGFVFPNLQPGRYQITATFQGFNPVTIQEVVVETARSVDLVVQFEVAGRDRAGARRRTVAGRRDDVDDDRQHGEQRADLEAAARRPQHPGLRAARARQRQRAPARATANTTACPAARSTSRSTASTTTRRASAAAARASSPSRRSGMGAIEEVTVSTAGLTADAGAEGAVQIQFVTKRGTQRLPRPGVRSDPERQAERAGRRQQVARASRRPSCGSTNGAPTSAARSSATSCSSSPTTSRSTRRARRRRAAPCSQAEAQQGVFRYTRRRQQRADRQPARHRPRRTACRRRIDPFVAAQFQTVNGALAQGNVASQTNLLQNTFRFIIQQSPNVNIYPTARVDYQASSNLADPRRAEPALARPADATRSTRACRRSTTGSPRPTTSCRPARTGRSRPNLFNQMSFGAQSNFEEFRPGNTLDDLRRRRAAAASTCRSMDVAADRPATSCRFRATTRSGTSPTR